MNEEKRQMWRNVFDNHCYQQKKGGKHYGDACNNHIMYGAIIGVISVVAYFVIKSAVKSALKEFKEEKRYEKN